MNKLKSMLPVVLALAIGTSVAAFAQQSTTAAPAPPVGTVPVTSQTPAAGTGDNRRARVEEGRQRAKEDAEGE